MFKKSNAQQWMVLAFALIYLLFLFIPPNLFLQKIHSFLPLHTVMETFSVVVSSMIFGIIWNTQHFDRARHVVILGAAFFAVALLDFAHLLSYKGMPEFVTVSSPQKAIVFWLAARTVTAVAMLVAAVMVWRPLVVPMVWRTTFWIGAAITSLVFWIELGYPQYLPVFWVDGLGLTTSKLLIEYGLIAMFIIAAGLFYRRSLLLVDDFDCRGLFLASSIMAISELCFTRYIAVTDVFNLLGHLYKVIAYLFLYQALFLQLLRAPYNQLKRSRDEIWLEKERAEVTLQAIMDGVVTTDQRGCVVSMNSVACRLTGWSNTAAQGLPLSAIYTAIDEVHRQPVDNPLFRCLKEECQVVSPNLAVITSASGAEYTVEQLASPIVDRCGEIIGGVIVIRDVTGRQQIQEQLIRKQRNLMEAQAIAHLGSWEWEMASNRVIWSEELFRIFGFTLNSIAPSYDIFLTLLHPDDKPKVLEAINQALLGGKSYDVEYRVIHRDSVVRYVHALGEVQRNQAGEPEKMLGTVLDITERKLAEYELELHKDAQRREAEIKTAILDALPANLVLIDVQGYIIAANHRWKAFAEENGLHANLVGIGTNYLTACERAIHLEADVESVVEGLGQVLSGASHQYACEYPCHSPDQQRWFRMLAVPLSASERLGAVVMHIDITESWQHKIEVESLNQQLELRVAERTKRLEETNQELEAFSYSVSHDLRAPLRIISGFAQILAADYGKTMDALASEHLQRILHASGRMGELIDDLLQLSHVSRGELNLKPVDLSQMVAQILAGFQQLEPQRNLKLTIAPMQYLYGDEHLIKIAMENLLGNAWKFSRHQAVSEIAFGQISNEAGSVYFIRDNGVGFNPKYAYKLFGAFQRLHSDEAFEGTGIGLATVQRIFTRHGGSVWAESQLGQGATFFFKV